MTTVPMWQSWAARLRALMRRARTVLAMAIAPGADAIAAATPGPPAHWAAKVRAGAPHLLEPAPTRTAAPVAWPATDPGPAPDAVLAWPPASTPIAAPSATVQPAAAPPRPSAEPSFHMARTTRRPDPGLDTGPPRPRRVVTLIAAITRPAAAGPVRWPRRRPRADGVIAPPPAPTTDRRTAEPVPLPVPGAAATPRAVPTEWPVAPVVAPTTPMPVIVRPEACAVPAAPAWPTARPRATVVELSPASAHRWPELPVDDDVDDIASAEPRVGGLTSAERLRREHEDGW